MFRLIQDLILATLLFVGFAMVTLMAVLYCLDVYQAIRPDADDQPKVDREFNKITRQ